MTKQQQRKEIEKKFLEMGIEAMYGKGGFWLRGQGWVSFSEARKMTGIEVPEELKRSSTKMTAYGDWGWVAGINRRMNG